ncbi:MAG: hypothetical protein V1799_18170 [bacterium]
MADSITKERTKKAEDKLFREIGEIAAKAGVAPGAFLRKLKEDFQNSPHPVRGLTNLHRFLSVGFASTIMSDFHSHRILQQIAIELFSQSQYLSDILVRNPELFDWLTSSSTLQTTTTHQELAQRAEQATSVFNRIEKKVDSLKRFHRREVLRLGARQILGEADVLTTSAEHSIVTDVIIDQTVRIAHQELSAGLEDPPENTLAVIGLGKLGGQELNFSSDIDLMFVYDRDEERQIPELRMTSLHHYYNRMAELIVRHLAEHSSEGYLYRIDMRLRPEGSSGPLALSRTGYLQYYETRGELWERQMLIKARVVGGDRSVGEKWLKDIQPFIYPKSLRSGPLEEIARIKSKIESRLTAEVNVKLGAGGIRDIEFIAQALQLLRGGDELSARQGNTINALKALENVGSISEKENQKLTDAYRFLRVVEDRLQLAEGLQRHSLPSSESEHLLLARQLGYNSAAAFTRVLQSHQSSVRKIFRGVFEIPASDTRLKSFGELSVKSQSRALEKVKFQNPENSAKLLKTIIQNVQFLQNQNNLSVLINLVQEYGSPDWTLMNFLVLASSPALRRTLHTAMSQANFLRLILLICSRSSRMSRLLSQEPLLFESLVGRIEDFLGGELGWTFLLPGDGLRFRQYNEFRISLQLLLGNLTIEQATARYSKIAEQLFQTTLCDELISEKSVMEIGEYSYFGLGKFGGYEMTLGSDLDLLLIIRAKKKVIRSKIELVARRIMQRLEGVYKIDFRLRPEGTNAPLTIDFEYYCSYLNRRASFWELQSLTKVRAIAGTPTLIEDVMQCVEERLYQHPLPDRWQKTMREMRDRMSVGRQKKNEGENLKLARGGLLDLEFVVQALQLVGSRVSPELRSSNSFTMIGKFVQFRSMRKDQVRVLRDNYSYFRMLETMIKLNTDTGLFVLPKEEISLQAILKAMGAEDLAAFRNTIEEKQRQNEELFNTYLL